MSFAAYSLQKLWVHGDSIAAGLMREWRRLRIAAFDYVMASWHTTVADDHAFSMSARWHRYR